MHSIKFLFPTRAFGNAPHDVEPVFRAFRVAILFLAILLGPGGLNPSDTLACANSEHPMASVHSNPPNVILILADDMGLDSVSAFNDRMGMKTPAIDRLASEGISFLDAHSPSFVCSPTRYSLLTGRYSWRSRLKRGIVGKWERPLIESRRLTLPEMLHQRGYHTACIGKWHLGWNWPKRGGGITSQPQEIDFGQPISGGPNDHGFDEYFGDDVPNWPPYAWRKNDRLIGPLTAQMKQGAMLGVSAGPAVADWDFHAVLSRYTEMVEAHIQQRAAIDQPFFLYFSLPSPHTPIAPGPRFAGKSNISDYADFLLQTDHAVATVLRAVESTGIADDTLILFMADNGTSPKADFDGLRERGVDLNVHWRGWKADVFEGGHRVPLIARWPGRIKPQQTCGQTVVLTDIMATVADVIGHSLGPDSAEDSVSLWPTMQGRETGSLHPNGVVHHSSSGHFAIRKGPWKLLFCRGSGGWSSPRENEAAQKQLPDRQLFRLDVDPRETRNVADSHPDVVKELTEQLRTIVEEGRSTQGEPQRNHGDRIWWKGLPWPNAPE